MQLVWNFGLSPGFRPMRTVHVERGSTSRRRSTMKRRSTPKCTGLFRLYSNIGSKGPRKCQISDFDFKLIAGLARWSNQQTESH